MTTIRVAIIGFGGIARFHYTAYRRLMDEGFPIEVVAVCDKNTAGLFDEVKINLGGDNVPLDKSTHIYTDMEELIAHEDFQLADVCLPTFLHAEASVKLLRAGKHVICEKPMALSGKECEEMVRAAKESGKQLMIGQCLRFDPHYLYLKKCIEEKTYGSLRYLTLERLCDYPLWASDFKNSQRTGGCILDTHIHDVDIARFLLGEPLEVSTIRYDNLPYCQVVNSRLFYEDLSVLIDVVWDDARPVPFAAGFHAKFDDACVISDGETVTVKPHGKERYTVEVEAADRIVEEIRAIALAIQSGKTSEVNPPESAMMSVKLVEMMKISAERRGENIKINF